MAELNATDYFNRRLAAKEEADRQFTPQDKLAELSRATENQSKALEVSAAAARKREALAANSWTGKLNLDANSFDGTIVNAAAQAYKGTSTMMGNVAAFAAGDLPAMMLDASLGEPVKQALTRYQQGTATPEDVDMITMAHKGDANPFATPEEHQAAQVRAEQSRFAETPLQMFDRSVELRKRGAMIRESFDRSDVVQADDQNALVADMGDGFEKTWEQVTNGARATVQDKSVSGAADVVSGLGKLLYKSVEAGVTHPMGSLGYVMENVPQLAVGAGSKAVLGLTNVAYASENYQKGITKYQEDNNGAYPPETQRMEMAAWAAGTALAEHASELAILKNIKLPGAKAVEKGVTEAVAPVVASPLKDIGKAVLHSTVEEAATEGFQTYGEGAASLTPASAKDIYVSAGIGGIVGGGMSGAGRTVNETAKALADGAQDLATKANANAAVAASFDTAVSSGDVSAFTDPKATATYAPEKAVSALYANSQLDSATPESKQANLDSAGQVIADLEERRVDTKQAYDDSTPAGLARSQANLARAEAALAAVDPADTTKKAAIENVISMTKELIADVVANPDQHIARQADLAKVDDQLKQARATLSKFNREVQTSDVDVTEQVATINAPVDLADAAAVATHAAAVDRVINLSMAAPERLESTVATAMADNQNNGLTAPQRTYLRAFSEARTAESQLKGVSGVANEVYLGGNGNKGIATYRADITTALASGNKKAADTLLKKLTSFALDHAAKATVAKTALDQSNSTRQSVEVLPDGNGGWSISTGAPLSAEARTKQGGMLFHGSTPATFVPQIKAESVAITKALDELNAAYAVKFSNATSKAANVTNVSQAQPAPAVPSAAVPKSPVVASTGTVPAAESAAGRNSGSVETNGVTQPVATSKTTAKPVAALEVSVEPAKAGPVARVESTESTDAVTAVTEAANAAVLTEKTEGTVASKQSKQSKESTTDANTAPKELVSPESVEPTSQKSGLSVLDKKSTDELPEGTLLGAVYRTINRATAFLSQKKTTVSTDADIAKARPLVDVRNLLSLWTAGTIDPASFFSPAALTADGKLSDAQRGAITTFKGYADKWAPLIQKNFIKGTLGTKKFLHLDPLQDFVKAKKDLAPGVLAVDENLVTGISYAAFSWLNEALHNPDIKDRESILAMHGLDQETGFVTDDGFADLSTVVAFHHTVIDSLGKRVIDVLGLKANANAPIDYMPKLAAALGLQALRLLQQEGFVSLPRLDGGKLMDYLPGFQVESTGTVKAKLDANGRVVEPARPAYPSITYVKIRRTADKALPVKSEHIKNSTVESQGALDTLFGSERTPVSASWEPMPFNQKTTLGTEQAISKEQTRILTEAQKVPNRIIPAMWTALSLLGDNIVLRAAGWKDPEGRIQAENLDSVLAQNNNLENQLVGMRELVNGAVNTSPLKLDQPFFANFEVWLNHRVGITTRDMNVQSSKIHRFMFFRPEWESTIRLDEQEKVDTFLVGIAAAFGIKTDQQSNTKTLEKLTAKLNTAGNRTIELAILLNKSIKDPGISLLSEKDKEDIADMASKAEGMQTLQALVAYGSYLAAVATDKKEVKDGPFTVHMLVGADGKTNGTILTHLALGAASSVKKLFAVMNRGGIYEKGNEATNFSGWFQKEDSLDTYQNLAKQIIKAIPRNTPNLKEFYVLTKPLLNADGSVSSAGRGIVKTPITAFGFGSSIKRSLETMQATFVQGVFDRIQEMADGTDTKTALPTLINSINVMLMNGGDSYTKAIPTDSTIEDLLALKFSKNQKAALGNAFDQIMGESVEKVMKAEYVVFVERRNVISKATQVGFSVYQAIYKELRDAEIARLIDAGEIDFFTRKGSDEKIPLHDLTVAQEAALKLKVEAVLPRTKSAYTGDLSTGLRMTKSTSSVNEMYRVEVQLGVPIVNKVGADTTQLVGSATASEEVSPGVAGLSYMIHGSDSAAMHRAIEGTQAFNGHDEIANGADKINDNARKINETLWTTMLRFSPSREAFEMLERAVINTVKLREAGDISDEALHTIMAAFGDMLPKGVREAIKVAEMPSYAVELTKASMLKAELVRLETMTNMATIDQYTWEGGEYTVTDANRKEAADRLAALIKEGSDLSEDTARAITEMEAMYRRSSKQAARKALELEGDPEFGPWTGAELGTTPGNAFDVIKASAAELDYHLETPHGVKRKSDADAVVLAVQEGKPLSEALNGMDNTLLSDDLSQFGDIVRDQPASTPFGELGSPRMQSDSDLVAFFEANPEASVDRVLQGLFRKFSKGSSLTKDFNLKLLKVLSKTINKELKINYITAQTDGSAVLDLPTTNSRGWYVSKGLKEEINVLSPEFKDSALTAEVLMHELTHAALAKVIDQELSAKKVNPKYTSETLDLVNELEALRQKASDFAVKNDITEYGAALRDIQEFVAWGMTNRAFQRDVISKVTMQSKTRKTELVAGMKAFIKSLVGILFRDTEKSYQAVAVNGMTVLVSNVSGLFNQAASMKTASANLNQSMATSNPMGAAMKLSTHSIHKALTTGAVSYSFSEHLSGVLDSIVEHLHGPFGSFKESLMSGQAITPLDVWAKAQATGKAPFASKVLASSLIVSDEEAFVIEQVEATVRAALASTKIAYTELAGLFAEARTKLKGVMPAADYDFVFNIEMNGDRSDYLARFAALGLAHEGFNTLLKFGTEVTDRKVANGRTMLEKIARIFQSLLEFFTNAVTNTRDGQQADEKLRVLVDQLVDIEAKKRLSIARAATSNSPIHMMEEGVTKLADGARGLVDSVATSGVVKNSSSAIIRGLGAAVSTVTGNRVPEVLDAIAELRDLHFKERHGIAMGLLDDVRGPKDFLASLLRFTKMNEGKRKDIITGTAKQVLGAFANGGKALTKELKKSVSAVVLRTGMHNLMGHFSLAEIENLVGDKTALDAAIKTFEDRLDVLPQFKEHYTKQANALGFLKVTGRALEKVVLLNAHNIASMYATDQVGNITAEQAASVKETIDVLITLRALAYSKPTPELKALFKSEAQRGELNGIEYILKLHKALEAESKSRLFKDNQTQMQHGYVSEIYNPHVGIKVANQEQGVELRDMGYVAEGQQLELDPADPDQQVLHIYKLKDGGLSPRVSGIMSAVSMKAKGDKQHGDYRNTRTVEGLLNDDLHNSIMSEKPVNVRRMYSQGPVRDLSNAPGNFMVPVLDDKGTVTNWRYLMHEDTKDSILERNNDFDQILGTVAGSIYDKETGPEQNKLAIQALRDQFKADKSHFRDTNYEEIGPRSEDPELREIWALLPDATRAEIRKIWGYDGMSIRKDSRDIVFGYRKLSLASMFRTSMKEKNEAADRAVLGLSPTKTELGQLEQMFVGVFEHILSTYGRYKHSLNADEAENYAKRAAVAVTRSERVWQAVVKETKDIIVVKTGVVMLGNIRDNLWLLLVSGVSIADATTNILIAMKGARAYQRDSEELENYKNLLLTGYTQGKDEEITHQIKRLQDALSRNPVRELIEGGLMPTIVEDIAASDDPYSYKSAFVKSTEKYTSLMHPNVLSAGKFLYMAHDTKAYQVLAHVTQMSDFVARFALYQHTTTRKKNPLSKAEAIQNASEAFVNYDVPMHRGMQYLDDMGVTMFTKYFLRMQKVLLRMSKENPGRVLMTAALGSYLDLGSNVLDSSAINHFGRNPFHWGALEFPGTLDNLATVSAGMALVK